MHMTEPSLELAGVKKSAVDTEQLLSPEVRILKKLPVRVKVDRNAIIRWVKNTTVLPRRF